jgi:hypothetical protein
MSRLRAIHSGSALSRPTVGGMTEGDNMLGAGEGLELLAIFLMTMFGLGVLVLLGKWWEA